MSSSNEKTNLQIAPSQAEHLATLFDLTKAFASPVRLAICGILALHNSTVEQLAANLSVAPFTLERDIRQLEQAGLIRVDEWTTPPPGQEPQPLRLSLNPNFAANMRPLTTTLAQINGQLNPAAKGPVLDERAKTIGQFIRNGKLTSIPHQFKRQLFIMEEVAKSFEPGTRYSERQIDVILKEIYAADHCTLRRMLVDTGYLRRENGIYWRTSSAPEELAV
jgi:hypothetical protein